MKYAFLSILALSLLTTGCGKITDALDNANVYLPQMGKLTTNTTDTNVHLTDMLKAVHDQALAQSLGVLFSKDAKKTYPDTPVGFFPGAEGFANNANTEEIAKITKVFMEQSKSYGGESFNADLNAYAILKQEAASAQGDKKAAAEQAKATRRAALIEKAKALNNEKKAYLVAVEAVVGAISQEKFQKLVSEQLNESGGSYTQEGFAIVLMRADYFKTVRLEGDLLQSKIINAKQLSDAIEFATNVDYIASLPRPAFLTSEKIQYTEAGMLPEDPDQPQSRKEKTHSLAADLSPDKMQSLWDAISSAKDNLLADDSLPAVQKAAVNNTLAPKIQQRLDYWTKLATPST